MSGRNIFAALSVAAAIFTFGFAMGYHAIELRASKTEQLVQAGYQYQPLVCVGVEPCEFIAPISAVVIRMDVKQRVIAKCEVD